MRITVEQLKNDIKASILAELHKERKEGLGLGLNSEGKYVFPAALKQRDDEIIQLRKKADSLSYDVQHYQGYVHQLQEEKLMLKQCVENHRTLHQGKEQVFQALREERDTLRDEVTFLRDCRKKLDDALTLMTAGRAQDRVEHQLALAQARLPKAPENFVKFQQPPPPGTVTLVKEANKPFLLFQGGDVWRSRGGTGITRCIISNSDGLVRYCYTGVSGAFHFKTRTEARLTEMLTRPGVNATVLRHSFFPAKFDGEPKEGYMVGDIWEKHSQYEEGVLRIITAVTDATVTYDVRSNGSDEVPFERTISRKHWARTFGSMEKATVTRK